MTNFKFIFFLSLFSRNKIGYYAKLEPKDCFIVSKEINLVDITSGVAAPAVEAEK